MKGGGRAPTPASGPLLPRKDLFAGLLGACLTDALFADVSLVGNLDFGLLARRTHVLARLERLVGKSLPLGGADAFDRRVIVEGGQVARNRAGGDLLREKAQAQRVNDAALIDSR